MSEVVKLFPAREPDEVLSAAMGRYSEVIVIGLTPEKMELAATLMTSEGDMIMALERTKMMLILEDTE